MKAFNAAPYYAGFRRFYHAWPADMERLTDAQIYGYAQQIPRERDRDADAIGRATAAHLATILAPLFVARAAG